MLTPHWLDEDEEDPDKPRLIKATGAADYLIEQYGHLAGHPVWMGIGINGMYTDEKVLSYIEWALQKRAGTFWLVLAHELAAMIRRIIRKTPLKHFITDRVFITTIDDVLSQMPTIEQARHTFALLDFFRTTLLRDQQFLQDAGNKNIEVLIQKIFLIFHLQKYANIGLKIGPITEEGPDAIYEKFSQGKYNIQPHNMPQTPQGFIYLS